MSSKKKAFVLRLDPETLEAVERWAADEFRSTNGQLEWLIAQALKQAGRWKKTPTIPAENSENTTDDAPESEPETEE
jgi:hypothetical protein